MWNPFRKRPSLTYDQLSEHLRTLGLPRKQLTVTQNGILIRTLRDKYLARVTVDDDGKVIILQFFLTCYPHVAARITNFLCSIAPVIIHETLLKTTRRK